MSPAEAQKARRAVINTIEKESLDRTKLRSDVVTLYNGGAYHLYRYKKYTDVRLVFAPEKDAAFFGGDPDNFEFPRFDLDVCSSVSTKRQAGQNRALPQVEQGGLQGWGAGLRFRPPWPHRPARHHCPPRVPSRPVYPLALNVIRRSRSALEELQRQVERECPPG